MFAIKSKKDSASEPFLPTSVSSSGRNTSPFAFTPLFFHSAHRSTLRMKEKYILTLTIATFIVFCIGGFFFLPELKAGTQFAVKQIKEIGPDLTGIIPPAEKSVPLNSNLQDPSRFVLPPPDTVNRPDRERFRAKLRQDWNFLNQSNAVLPKPFDTANSDSAPEGDTSQSSNKQQWIPLDSTLLTTHSSDPRAVKVREMTKHAWNNYVKYAWGDNELRPISRVGHDPGIFGRTKLGATIVDAMDTLFIMGLEDEFQKGRQWIEDNLTIDNVNVEISAFEFNIRFIGGLLSCYALTKDRMFLQKAESFVQKIMPVFDTNTGLPYALINPSSGQCKNYMWASSGSSILSEVGSFHLEFTYLTAATGNPVYAEKVQKVRDYLDSMSKVDGLYPNYINPRNGHWGQHHVSVGALGDSFYEYLIKAWIQSNGQDEVGKRMYQEAVEHIVRKLLKRSEQSKLLYLCEMRYERQENKMDHLACFAGGMFGLGSATFADAETRRSHMEIAKDLTNTCHESYNRTATGLGPESFRFTDAVEARAVRGNEKYYILRPEVVESYFYLWRLTKDEKYRQWAWEVVLALEKYCRVDGGFTGLRDVYNSSPNAPKDDVQQSFFFAELLKYLYLIFSDDQLIPLDQWVFNTEAHVLPIKDKNPAYPVSSNGP